jgi:hypothetical protein
VFLVIILSNLTTVSFCEDQTIGDQNDLDETGSFDVTCAQFFCFFQIVCSGNTSSNSDYLMMGGFEVYGFLSPRYL